MFTCIVLLIYNDSNRSDVLIKYHFDISSGLIFYIGMNSNDNRLIMSTV